MKQYVKLFENWSSEKIITLTSRQGRDIIITVRHGKIEEVDNQSGVRFPFVSGQLVTVFLKSWACNNGFSWDGKDACDPGEKKVFGVKVKDVPKGHEWRSIWPHKFND